MLRVLTTGFLWVLLNASCSAATLVFDRYAEIKGDRLHLGDIAKIEGGEAWAARLQDLDLGKAPSAGRTEKIEATRVLAWVRSRMPYVQDLKIQGEKTIWVQRASSNVDSTALLSLAVQALTEHFPAEGEWRLLSQHVAESFVVPDVPFRLKVADVRSAGACERASVRIDAVSEVRTLASMVLWFEHAKMNNVCAESFAQRAEWAVEKMGSITIEMRTSALMIETSGTALASGEVGEIVRVRRSGGTQSFSALVTGRGRVRVVAEAEQ